MATWRKRGDSQSRVRNFSKYMRLCARLYNNTSGSTAVEYALMVALISVVVMASLVLLGDPIEGLFGGVSDQFTELEINQD